MLKFGLAGCALALTFAAAPAVALKTSCAADLLPPITASFEDPPPANWNDLSPDAKTLAAYNRPSEVRQRAQVKANLAAYMQSLPVLHVKSLKNLDALYAGQSYRLSAPPSLELIASLPKFRPEMPSEISLVKFESEWFLTVGGPDAAGFTVNTSVGLPRFLELLRLEKSFAVNLHSHPALPGQLAMPSLPDLMALLSTRNGKAYISTQDGLVEMNSGHELPGGYHLPEISKSLQWWLANSGFRGSGEEMMKAFTEAAAATRIIPWSNTAEIKRLLEL